MRVWWVGMVVAAGLGAAASCTLSTAGSGVEGFGSTGSGAGGSGGNNPQTPCATRADCPADDVCVSYACANGLCAPSFAPAGTPAEGSAAGDCRKRVCSGSNYVTDVADDTDLPDDGNDCTGDACAGGLPQHPPLPDDTPCGAGAPLRCAQGVCVGCTTPSECSSNPCQDPTCASNQCGTTPKAAGVEASDTSPADCTHEVCDGSGLAVVEADSDDEPDDMNECTADSCQGAVASNVPEPNGTTCGSAMHCYMGACSQCGVDADCPVANECKVAPCAGGVCQPAQNKADGTPCGNQAAGDVCCGGVCTAGGVGGGGGAGGGGGGGVCGGAGGAGGA